MKAHIYPAYFRPLASGSISIDFPDLPGCVTGGDTLEEAVTMAREALSLHLFGLLEDGEPVPAPSDPGRLAPSDGSYVAIVEGRPDMVRDEIRNRSVKKTLTIPYWLNEEAEKHNINFSQVLQEALKDRVGI